MIPPVAAANDKRANDLEKPEILRAQGRAQKGPKTAPEAPAFDPELVAERAPADELRLAAEAVLRVADGEPPLSLPPAMLAALAGLREAVGKMPRSTREA